MYILSLKTLNCCTKLNWMNHHCYGTTLITSTFVHCHWSIIPPTNLYHLPMIILFISLTLSFTLGQIIKFQILPAPTLLRYTRNTILWEKFQLVSGCAQVCPGNKILGEILNHRSWSPAVPGHGRPSPPRLLPAWGFPDRCWNEQQAAECFNHDGCADTELSTCRSRFDSISSTYPSQ